MVELCSQSCGNSEMSSVRVYGDLLGVYPWLSCVLGAVGTEAFVRRVVIELTMTCWVSTRG